jgi:hypothetical protein
MIYKTLHRKLKIELRASQLNTEDELRCSTSGTRRATLVTTSLIKLSSTCVLDN